MSLGNNDELKTNLDEFVNSVDEIAKKIHIGFENAVKDAGKRTVKTKYGNTVLTTDIGSEFDLDVNNDFPENAPEKDNVYWVYHKELVSKIVDVRKEILLKMIETTGTTIKGIVNPVSIVSSD